MGLFDKLLLSTNETKEKTVNTITDDTIKVKVNRNNIKNIPSAKYLIDTCSGLISAMPMQVKQMDETGIHLIKHDLDYLLNNENHWLSTSCELKRNMVFDYLVEGNAYALVNRNGNRIESIEYIKPNTITFEKVYSYNNDVVDVKVTIQDDRRKMTPEFSDVIIVGNQLDNYFKGRGLLKECNELLEQSLHMDRANISSLTSSVRLNGIVSFDAPFKREIFKQLKEDMKQMYRGYDTDNLMVVNGGVKYTPTNNLSGTESQLVEQKELLHKFLLESYGISKIGDMESLYKNVLLGIIENFEQSFSKALLLESEKEQGYYIAFDTSEILRGSFKEHSETVLNLFNSGLITDHEARELLGMNRPTGKPYNLQSLGNVYHYADNTVYIPNTDTEKTLNNTSQKE